MAYLIEHMALSLAFAQLLGLLLGWLLWGYAARQRDQEVRSLRHLLAEVPVSMPRVALANSRSSPGALEIEGSDVFQTPGILGLTQEKLPIAAAPGDPSRAPLAGSLLKDDLPGSGSARSAVFLSTPDQSRFKPAVQDHERTKIARVHSEPDGGAEVSRIRLLEQEIQELTPLRDRLPKLEAELLQVTAQKAVVEDERESRQRDFDVRMESLLGQIRAFEENAREWDRLRSDYERVAMLSDKELAAANARIVELQNRQVPEKAASPSISPALEVAQVRDRFQQLMQERDSLTAELAATKKTYSNGASGAARVEELERALYSREANLAEQATRVEALLWRVAELEPFATEAPGLHDSLARLESEVAGHLTQHAENAERIRSLINRVAELEGELQTTPDNRDEEIASYQAAVQDQARQLAEFKAAYDALMEREAQLRLQLDAPETGIHALENRIATLSAEARQTRDALDRTHAELQRLPVLTQELNSAQQYVSELEPKAQLLAQAEAKVAQSEKEFRQQIQDLTARHQTKVLRLRTSSATSIRRLRRSLLS